MDTKIKRLVLICLLLALSACSKSTVNDSSPAAETFRLLESCSDLEGCCVDRCKDYCVSNNGNYEKHVVNGQTCACFCAEG